MTNIDAVLSHLRAGGLVQLQDKSGSWLLCSTRQNAAYQKLADTKFSYSQAFVLIASMNELYEYVLRFSDLAWDIADQSEKALLVWYDFAKDLPAAFKDELGNAGIMLNRCNTLQPLLQKLGHGLFCIQPSASDDSWQGLPNMLPLPLDKDCSLAPERIMRLSAGGDVKFLKY